MPFIKEVNDLMSSTDAVFEISITDDPEIIRSYIPPLLYKYRDWTDPYHKTIVTDRQLYFPSAYDFEDIKDCRFPAEHDFSYESIEAFWRREIRNVNNRSWTDEQIRAMARYYFNENF